MESKISYIKGCLSGILASLIINTMIVFQFFNEVSVISINFFVLIIGTVIMLLLITNNTKTFFISLVLSIFTFVLTEVFLLIVGVVPMFYRISYGSEAEMGPANGLLILLMYMHCIGGCSIGTTIALIITIVKNRKRNKSK